MLHLHFGLGTDGFSVFVEVFMLEQGVGAVDGRGIVDGCDAWGEVEVKPAGFGGSVACINGDGKVGRVDLGCEREEGSLSVGYGNGIAWVETVVDLAGF